MAAISNPFSTSGSGVTFEQLVGSLYMVSLLSQEMPRGISSGICKEVRFQQRWAGCLVDDIVVIADDGFIERKIAIQIKHDLPISDSNSTCQEVFTACWKTFKETNFNQETDTLAIGLGIFEPKIDKHFRFMLELARTAGNSQEFLQKMNTKGFTSKEKKEYLCIVTNLLNNAKEDNITDDELWRFLKCLIIIYYDLESMGSRDSTYAWNRIITLTKDHNPNQAKLLFNELTAIAQEYNRCAGSITESVLRKKLSPEIALVDAPNCRQDLVNLRKHTDLVLALINDSIGLTVKLPRIDKLDELERASRENEVVIISDEPMTGKSALIKLFANRLRLGGEVIAFAVERFSGSSLSAFLQSINITNDFSAVLSSIGSAPYRCILIDGIEKAKDEEKKRILNELILSILEHNKLVLDANGHLENCWRIVCTCRALETENILFHTEFRKVLANKKLKTMAIGGLSDNEIAYVSDKFPMINALIMQKNLRDFLSKPLILDILTLPGIQLSTKALPPIFTESWLLDWYWKEIVRLGEGTRSGLGHPDKRENIMKALAINALKGDTRPLTSSMDDADAISGLVSDRLLKKEADTLRFAHDVIQDWALTILLKTNETDLLSFLLEFNDNLSLTRPFSLYSALLLEIQQSPSQWFTLVDSLKDASSLSPRWRQSVFLQLLASPMLKDLLSTLKQRLYGDSALLCDLLKYTHTFCVKTDTRAYDIFYGLNEVEIERYLPYWTIPIYNQWLPIIELALENQEVIKGEVLNEFSYICQKWMSSTINDVDQSLRERIAGFSLSILKGGLLEEYDDQPKNRYILSALYAANCMPKEISDFIRMNALRNRKRKTLGFEELILEQGWIPICRFLPDIALALLKRILCVKLKANNNYRFGYQDLTDLAIRYGHWNPPTYFEGPFLGFVRLNEKQGLALINAIVNHATEAWIKRETNDNRQPVPQVLTVNRKNIEVWGDEHVYHWYRYPSVAPTAITCALMTLEYWLTEQITNEKKTPSKLFENILNKTKSVSVVGVCASVALANIEVCKEAVMPILLVPAFWITDQYRFSQDLTSENMTRHFANTFSFNKQDRHNYKILIDLAQQPHRKMNFSNFVPPILFSGNTELKEQLVTALTSFPNKVPFFFLDEQDNKELKARRIETCKIIAAWANPDNYEINQVNNGVEILFKKPAALEQEQKERTEELQRINELYGLLVWSLNILDGEKTINTTDIEPFFQLALKFACADNVTYQPTDVLEYSESRAQAIAAFAAAISLRYWTWVKDNAKLEWFKEQLLIAASRPLPPSELNDNISIYPMGYRRSAARALCALERRTPDNRLRESIMTLSIDVNDEVRSFLFNGLQELWSSEPKLVWNCIDSNIKSANIFHEKNRKLSEFLPSEIDTHMLMPLLYCIPSGKEVEAVVESNAFLDFLEEILLFTIKCYTFAQEGSYNQWEYNDWNKLIFNAIGNVTLRTTKAPSKFYSLLLEKWLDAPSIMTQFLRSLLSVGTIPELEDRLAEIWPIIGTAIIPKIDSISNDDSETLAGLLLFADPHYIITWQVNNWKPLRRLVPFIETWCQEVGWKSRYFPNIVRLLKSVGFELFEDYGINWLFTCLTKIDNEKQVLEKNANSLSELLLNGWLKYSKSIEKNPEKMHQFAFMVDKLANYGDPAGIRLQSKILNQ